MCLLFKPPTTCLSCSWLLWLAVSLNHSPLTAASRCEEQWFLSELAHLTTQRSRCTKLHTFHYILCNTHVGFFLQLNSSSGCSCDSSSVHSLKGFPAHDKHTCIFEWEIHRKHLLIPNIFLLSSLYIKWLIPRNLLIIRFYWYFLKMFSVYKFSYKTIHNSQIFLWVSGSKKSHIICY